MNKLTALIAAALLATAFAVGPATADDDSDSDDGFFGDGTIILIQCRNTAGHIRVQNTSPLPIDLPGTCAQFEDCTGCLNTLIEESGCEINEAAPPLHAIQDDIQFILGCDS